MTITSRWERIMFGFHQHTLETDLCSKITSICVFVCCHFRYAHPVFPHEDDIVHVGPWDVGNQPIADWCTYSIECQYEVS